MKQEHVLKMEGGKVQNLLSDFFAQEKKKHRSDGETAIASLEVVYTEMRHHEVWGKIPLVPFAYSNKKIPELAYAMAAAFELLATTLVFQTNKVPVPASLSVRHFPAKSRAHANKSMQIVLGDLALTLMHNLLLEIRENSSVILRYQQAFSRISRNIFSHGIISNKNHDLFSKLFLESVVMGATLAEMKKQQKDVLIRAAKSFYVDMKKESALADSFYSLLGD